MCSELVMGGSPATCISYGTDCVVIRIGALRVEKDLFGVSRWSVLCGTDVKTRLGFKSDVRDRNLDFFGVGEGCGWRGMGFAVGMKGDRGCWVEVDGRLLERMYAESDREGGELCLMLVLCLMRGIGGGTASSMESS
jgi:hypothetical protein